MVLRTGRSRLDSSSFLASSGSFTDRSAGSSPTGSQGVTPRRKQSSLLKMLPMPGEVALVQQGLPEGAGRVLQEVCQRQAGSQSGPRRSGPRWPTARVLVGVCASVPGREPVADDRAVGGAEDGAIWWAGPPFQRCPGAYTRQEPSIPQVRVQRQAAFGRGSEGACRAG
ncbi:hypothetical protein GCM10023238_13350 [Streptomyces heliomycini]